jgi:hypothetical protein
MTGSGPTSNFAPDRLAGRPPVRCRPRGVAALWSALARVRERAWALGAAPQGPLTIDLEPPWSTPTPTSRARRRPTSTASGFTRWGPGWTAGTAPGRPWRGSCGRATPAPTPPKTISTCWRWPCWRCPSRPAASRSWFAPTQPAPPTPLSPTSSAASCSFRSDSRWSRRSRPRSWPSRRQPTVTMPAGCQPWTPTAVGVPARGCGSFRPWTLPARAGPAGPGRSAVASGPLRRPHKMGFTDHTGHRFQVFITNQPDPTLTPSRRAARAPAPPGATSSAGQQRHRRPGGRPPRARPRRGPHPLWQGRRPCQPALQRLRRQRCLADPGPGGQTLVCWAQALLLDGEPARAEPKTLRYRLWHAAGRIVHHARRVILRFDRAWPWAGALVAAFGRLHALPARC